MQHQIVKRSDRKTGLYCGVCRLRMRDRNDDSECGGLPCFTTEDYGLRQVEWLGDAINGEKTFEQTTIKKRLIPENFYTKTQLKKMGLEPKGNIVGYLRLRIGAKWQEVPLYDVYAKGQK